LKSHTRAATDIVIPAMNYKWLGTLIAVLALAATHLPGAAPVEIRLSDVSGKWVVPLAKRGQKFTLLFFLTTECPIGNRYAPEISRIVRDYESKGISCHAIYAQETLAEITEYQRQYKLTLSALLDPELKLAKLTGATVTPEACILGPDGGILYRGRIDDRAVKYGTVSVEPRVRDLRLALDAVLAGQPVAEKFTRAIGCHLAEAEPSQ
jgi:peroxiredoxin